VQQFGIAKPMLQLQLEQFRLRAHFNTIMWQPLGRPRPLADVSFRRAGTGKSRLSPFVPFPANS
jgi:hypothetical protein